MCIRDSGDGEPDAVDAEKFWQKKYRGDLNDERAQERNERAGCAIVEPREKRQMCIRDRSIAWLSFFNAGYLVSIK